MAANKLILAGVLSLATVIVAFVFWRYVWFFRNPERHAPSGQNIVSPADGTVVYVKEFKPGDDVMVIKQGVSATIKDIVREDLDDYRILIGVFMSPFNVHYNRSPISGKIDFIKHYPAKLRNLHMGDMHLRTILGLLPFHENSPHIIENERTVTRISGKLNDQDLSVYVVQIAAKNVNGIDSYKAPHQHVDKGEVFGMIRIGSQVDIITRSVPNMKIRVKPGDSVRAGETILID